MAEEQDITIGELSRTIARLDGRLTTQLDGIGRRLDGLQFVHRETYSVEMQAMKARLEVLEDSKKWTARTLVASFIFPILVSIMVALLAVK